MRGFTEPRSFRLAPSPVVRYTLCDGPSTHPQRVQRIFRNHCPCRPSNR
jgi:hypothetical protein